jgi:phosphatidylglycerol phospholipase C
MVLWADKYHIYVASWAYSHISTRDPSRRVPQAIAHRGYKAVFPENTMKAFTSALQVGAHAIETDLHLTKDGVVVLSHVREECNSFESYFCRIVGPNIDTDKCVILKQDGTLKRCFGVDKKINECDWKYVRTLRTLREPPEPMPRLIDLLEYLAQPGLEKIWLLLDVKVLSTSHLI